MQHSNPTYCNIVGRNMLHAFGQSVAMCCDMLGVVGSSLKMVKFEPTTPNNTQHLATCRNTVAKRTQHVAPNNVAICCVGMLRSFGRGLRFERALMTQTSCAVGMRNAKLGNHLNCSVCETMEDYNEGYLMVCTNYISPCSSIVGLYFKGTCDVISVTMATHKIHKSVL